jgi:hypothetical protein
MVVLLSISKELAMGRLVTAFKTFIKAFREPQKAVNFLGEGPKKIEKKRDEPDHLRFLTLLQRSGRLVDFLKEDITPYSDAQVGAVVRKVHEDCGKSLEELVTVRPVVEEEEGADIEIPAGYDPSEFKVVGSVKGDGPYKGKLVHKGWRAHKRTLPRQVGELNTDVVYPAEVEVKG